MVKTFLCLALILPLSLMGREHFDQLARDLEIAKYWDDRLDESFPLGYTDMFLVGYFVTPSARMDQEGKFGIQHSHAYPYFNWNVRGQGIPWLSLSVFYRSFIDYEDLDTRHTSYYGNYADRGLSFKLGVIDAKDFDYQFPSISIGVQDCIGSKKFRNYFVVGTQIFPSFGLELTFGWGSGMFSHGPSNGYYGGGAWFPFWRRPRGVMRGLSFVAEYDPTNYASDPNPNGRSSRSPINYGLKYQLWDAFFLSVGSERGEALEASAALVYHFGKSATLVPKTKAAPLYQSPVNREPLGCYRPRDVFAAELVSALKEQQIFLYQLWKSRDELWVIVSSNCYIDEGTFRERAQHVLGNLVPDDISKVHLVVASYGTLFQEYVYPTSLLKRYVAQSIGDYEFDLLTPREDADCVPADAQRLICRKPPPVCLGLNPGYFYVLGSGGNKFKTSIGATGTVCGYLPREYFYLLSGTYFFYSNANNLPDRCLLNPSQLPNVATDINNYFGQNAYIWSSLYLQKTWNIKQQGFGRVAAGYFQVNYGGIGGEYLWYPSKGRVALGLDGAFLWKRRYTGFGFQSKLRELSSDGKSETYIPYSVLSQYFLSMYLEFPALDIYTQTSVGQFLAGDKGVYLKVVRTFKSGIHIGAWLTYTDAREVINGENYFDRGILINIPYNLFSRKFQGTHEAHSVTAWTRDAGYRSSTGFSLYEMLHRRRIKY